MYYSNRVVCFVDILGFKNQISHSIIGEIENEDVTSGIIKCFDAIKYYNNPASHIDGFTERFIFTQFSDCFTLSFDCSEKDMVYYSLLQILWTQTELASIGILCRGGISSGLAAHTNDYVFGPAIVNAYNMEQKAFYPRIIADQSIIDVGVKSRGHNNEHDQREYICDILKQDDDGLYYIDYFESSKSELDETGFEYPQYLNDIYEHIVKGLLIQDARVNAKYLWMQKKYNNVVRSYLDAANHTKCENEKLIRCYSTLKLI